MVLRGRDCVRPQRSRHAAQRSYPSLLLNRRCTLPRPRLFLGKGLARAHRAYDEKRGIWDQSRGDGAGGRYPDCAPQKGVGGERTRMKLLIFRVKSRRSTGRETDHEVTQRVMDGGNQVRKLLWSHRVVPNVAADGGQLPICMAAGRPVQPRWASKSESLHQAFHGRPRRGKRSTRVPLRLAVPR